MLKLIYNNIQLDTLETSVEFTFEIMDYTAVQPGKPYKTSVITFPDTPNNVKAFGSLFGVTSDFTDRTITNVIFDNGLFTTLGKLVLIELSKPNGFVLLSGVFVSGCGLTWLDYGDKKLKDLDWSEYNHILNYENIQKAEENTLNDLCMYDLCDRGLFIDGDVINITERFPIFKLDAILSKILEGYDVQSNFRTSEFWQGIYLLFTQNNEIRNSDDWKSTALFKAIGSIFTSTYLHVLNAWTDFDVIATVGLSTGVVDAFDNDNNWNNSAKYYQVPETGTYRFKFKLDVFVAIPSGANLLLRYNTGGGNPRLRVVIKSQTTGTIYAFDDTAEVIGGNASFDKIIDTDFIELTKDDRITVEVACKGQYRQTVDIFVCSMSDYGAYLENSVTRYYGYGSEVEIAKLMPDVKINTWLSDLFKHFSIIPQYSNETNILRLLQYQRYTNIKDLTPYVLDYTANIDYGREQVYDLKFTEDTTDQPGNDYFIENKSENGNFYSPNQVGKQLERFTFTSPFSNTRTDKMIRVAGIGSPKVPVLWNARATADVPIPAFNTVFNKRLLLCSGKDVYKYQFSYHAQHQSTDRISGRTIVNIEYVIFEPYNNTYTLEFSNRNSLSGLKDRLHRFYFERLKQAVKLEIEANLPLDYLMNLLNSDQTYNMGTPVYIGTEPNVGVYQIQKIVTNGDRCKLELIRAEDY